MNVVRTPSSSFDLILGMDFMQPLGINLDNERQVVTWGDLEAEYKQPGGGIAYQKEQLQQQLLASFFPEEDDINFDASYCYAGYKRPYQTT